MKQLLNTMFVMSDDIYLGLDGENVVAYREGDEVGRRPLHTLEGILYFGHRGVSPALMEKCVDAGIAMTLLTQQGRFRARVQGASKGNVLLRREQYRIADDQTRALGYAQGFIYGKLYNSRWVLERACRDHELRVDVEKLKRASERLHEANRTIMECADAAQLRGIEGDCAAEYFGVFDELILQNKQDFVFGVRSHRPPLNRVNALLSLFYTMLAHDCAAALESVGLDAYMGFMHTARPGRESLALDLMEEMRSCIVDRFVLTLINNRVVTKKSFHIAENGAVRLTDDGRNAAIKAWQERKHEEIRHPFLEEKVQWGMVPYAQALLLARTIRGDIDAYPPFLWK